uniref:Uncharacterized protein n=1 Tax=viral metagenome TaxID=1070528 RepID=A0A6M3KWN8_9ZZZZ
MITKEEPTYARGFKAGRESVLRQNKSGCCCKFDEAGEEVIEPCAAHKMWLIKEVRNNA